MERPFGLACFYYELFGKQVHCNMCQGEIPILVKREVRELDLCSCLVGIVNLSNSFARGQALYFKFSSHPVNLTVQ